MIKYISRLFLSITALLASILLLVVDRTLLISQMNEQKTTAVLVLSVIAICIFAIRIVFYAVKIIKGYKNL